MNKYIWGMVWIFAACRGEADPPVVVDIEQVDPSEQELVFWYQHTLKREDRLNDLLAEFNTGNVYGISVRGEYAGGYTDIYNKMVVGIQGGILPALVVAYNNQANAYFANGGAVDLAPYMSSVQWGLTAEARQDYYGDFLAQDRFDGVQVALPPNRSLELLYYNADWLRELGHQRPPEDWATFVALCRRAQAVPFSKNGSGRSLGWVLPADASHLASIVFGLGGGFIDEQQRAYTLDSPEVREALLMLRELVVDERPLLCAAPVPKPLRTTHRRGSRYALALEKRGLRRVDRQNGPDSDQRSGDANDLPRGDGYLAFRATLNPHRAVAAPHPAQRDLLDQLAHCKKSLYQQRLLEPYLVVGTAQFAAEVVIDLYCSR